MPQAFEKLIAAAFLAALAASSAKADWQYTKWGMTVRELAETAPHESALRRGPIDSDYTVLIGDYSAEKFSFESRFEFSENGLEAVRLKLNDRSIKGCGKLGDALVTTHGPADEGFVMYRELLLPTPYKRWRDNDAGNIITLIGVDDCDLLYKPINPPRRKIKGL